MDFEEFCAAAISPYQLEALERWEEIAGTAFQHFEQEGNRVISVEELAKVFIVQTSWSTPFESMYRSPPLFFHLVAVYIDCPDILLCYRNLVLHQLIIPLCKTGSESQMAS
jgi:hypothetical protein